MFRQIFLLISIGVVVSGCGPKSATGVTEAYGDFMADDCKSLLESISGSGARVSSYKRIGGDHVALTWSAGSKFSEGLCKVGSDGSWLQTLQAAWSGPGSPPDAF